MHFPLAYLVWDPNPAIIPGLPFRWYGLFFAISFFLGYLIIRRYFTIEKIPFYHMEKMAIPMVLGTIGGARLGHCLFYEPAYYLEHPEEIIMVWRGGLASHGAAIGIILAMFLYARKAKWPILWLFDRIAVTVALSGLLIRCGNFMNSEILGKETNVPWGVVFQQADQDPPKNKAGWVEDRVELTFSARPTSTKQYLIYRTQKNGNMVLAGIQPVDKYTRGGTFQFSENSPGKDRILYSVLDDVPKAEIKVKPYDSTDTREAFITLPLLGDTAAGFGYQTLRMEGKWMKDEVALVFHAGGEWRNYSFSIWCSYDNINFRPITKVTAGAEGIRALKLVDRPQAGKKVYYRVLTSVEEQVKVDLYARHPSMLYEGFLNFFIFVFLYLLYNRYKGKVPHGLITGYFMLMLFTGRILLEFTKVEQTDFQHSMPLNMGQMLSLPLVLFGIVLLLTRKNASTASPVENESKSS